MKEQIQKLIKHHRNCVHEARELLNELTAMNDTKLDLVEKDSLKETILRLDSEVHFRNSFVSQLEDLV